jgi:hypothetical protein
MPGARPQDDRCEFSGQLVPDLTGPNSACIGRRKINLSYVFAGQRVGIKMARSGCNELSEVCGSMAICKSQTTKP